MCGINGLVSRVRDEEINRKLSAMNQLIRHRGPDDDGFYIDGDTVGMAMRRLSIIDLAHGKQPMQTDDLQCSIVFNGEIYNYLDLKKEEEQNGAVFKTQSDTEVVLYLYHKYGPACLQRLNGMFAFSIHDKRSNTVFIARDRFGEKPLYYHHGEESFVWCSELKSMVKVFPALKQINRQVLPLFFALTYIPAPHCIYKDVCKLLPAHYMIIDTVSWRFESKEYWSPIGLPAQPQVAYGDAQQHLRSLLFESVEKRMIADVPLGVFLSGGVDSTIIAAIMAKIAPGKLETFTVAYSDKAYDESDRAAMVASHIGAHQHVFTLNPSAMLETLDEVVLNYDEPFADSSALPTYFISSQAASRVKVALTGDGGDEVFGGYNKYRALHYRALLEKWTPSFVRKKMTDPATLEKWLGGKHPKSMQSKIKRFLGAVADDARSSHLNMIALGFRQPELERLLATDFPLYKEMILQGEHQQVYDKLDGLKLLRYIDMDISLEGDMLVKVDRASMRCSLECRAPFLDHRIMEQSFLWKDDFLVAGTSMKHILKDTFKDLLPPGFFNSPKSGFEVPVGEWLRAELAAELTTLLSAHQLEKHGILNTSYVQQLLEEHLSRRKDHSWKLWTLFCFQKWYNHHFN